MKVNDVVKWGDFTNCDAFQLVAKHLVDKYGEQLAFDILDGLDYQLQGVQVLADQPDKARALESCIEYEKSYKERLEKEEKAKEHLESAAELLGLRKTFFYSLAREENDGMGDVFKQTDKSKLYTFRKGNDVSTIPPRLEGETDQEYKARQGINRLFNSPILSNPYLQYLKTKGKASDLNKAANGVAVRIIWEWEGFPKDIRYPYKIITGLLECCGFEITRENVKSIINGTQSAKNRVRTKKATKDFLSRPPPAKG